MSLELKIDHLLCISIGVSMFNCVGINDYSCGFLFACLMIWTKSKQKNEATFIQYVMIAMIIYDIIWIALFGNAWYMNPAKTTAWKNKAKIRGFCFILYIVNLVLKVMLMRYSKKFGTERNGGIENKSLI